MAARLLIFCPSVYMYFNIMQLESCIRSSKLLAYLRGIGMRIVTDRGARESWTRAGGGERARRACARRRAPRSGAGRPGCCAPTATTATRAPTRARAAHCNTAALSRATHTRPLVGSTVHITVAYVLGGGGVERDNNLKLGKVVHLELSTAELCVVNPYNNKRGNACARYMVSPRSRVNRARAADHLRNMVVGDPHWNVESPLEVHRETSELSR